MTSTAKRFPGDPALLRMRAKRDETKFQLDALRGRLRAEAEARTRTMQDLPPTFGRHASDWTKHHESFFQHRLSELTALARNEIGALDSKLRRQNDAIAQHHLRASRRSNAR